MTSGNRSMLDLDEFVIYAKATVKAVPIQLLQNIVKLFIVRNYGGGGMCELISSVFFFFLRKYNKLDHACCVTFSSSISNAHPKNIQIIINPARTFCNVTKLRSSSFGTGNRQQKHFDIIAAKIR